MNKSDFFIYSITSELYIYRGWIESVFYILVENSPDKHLHDHGVYMKDKKLYGLVDGKEVHITDFVFSEPLYKSTEQLVIKAHQIKCVKRDIITSYGIAIINAFYIEYPYSGKHEYINPPPGKPITASQLNDVALHMLITDKATVAEHKKFENAVCATTPLVECCLVPATEKSFINNKQIARKRDELIKANEGRLNDGAVIAGIQAELEKLDVEYLKGDPSEYYNSTKKARASRTRVHLMFGGEQDYFDTTSTNLVSTSLQEGIQLKDIPIMANSIREASRRRAVATANGGAKVKEITRVLANYTIVSNVCTTKRGIRREINNDNYTLYKGRYLVNSNKPLTESDLQKYIGKKIHLRSTQWCSSPDNTVCPICIGDTIYATKIGISALANTMTSTLMLIDMSAMHTSGLKTTKYNFTTRIT